MLVLARRVGESIIIEDDDLTKEMKKQMSGQEEPPVRVTIDGIEGKNQVNLMINAVKRRPVNRLKVYKLIQAEKQPNMEQLDEDNTDTDEASIDIKKLYLSGRVGDSIIIEDDIPTKEMKKQMKGQEEPPVRVTILRINGNQVSVGVDADKNRPVHRLEVYQRIQFENQNISSE